MNNSAAPQDVTWTRGAILAARDRLIASRGPWTSHTIHLGHGIYTREQDDNWRVPYFSRILRDFGFADLAGRRILDLGCLEGVFGIEFARAGAETTGIEVRAANIEKAIFARDVLQLQHCRFIQEDVRNLAALQLGTFDVVICCGLLYHLEASDAIELIRQISNCCSLAVFDTHIAPETLGANRFELSDPVSEIVVGGQRHRGRYFREFPPGLDKESKERRLWASAGNDASFWFSKASLYRALETAGFRGIYDTLHDLSRPSNEVDRVILAAVR